MAVSKVRKEKDSFCAVVTYSITKKCEIRKFRVAVM